MPTPARKDPASRSSAKAGVGMSWPSPQRMPTRAGIVRLILNPAMGSCEHGTTFSNGSLDEHKLVPAQQHAQVTRPRAALDILHVRSLQRLAKSRDEPRRL